MSISGAEEPRWLTYNEAIHIHSEMLRLFGGAAGVRDDNGLHSALASPINHCLYENVDDLLVLAVRLGAAVTKAHAFIDGNKRTGFAAMISFLSFNGYGATAEVNDLLGRDFEKLTAGKITENDFANLLAPMLYELSLDEEDQPADD